MPKIRIKLFANLREFTGTRELELEGRTLEEVLDLLCDKYPGLKDMIFEGDTLRGSINIFLNGEDVQGRLTSGLNDGDEVALFPPVSGG